MTAIPDAVQLAQVIEVVDSLKGANAELMEICKRVSEENLRLGTLMIAQDRKIEELERLIKKK